MGHKDQYLVVPSGEQDSHALQGAETGLPVSPHEVSFVR